MPFPKASRLAALLLIGLASSACTTTQSPPPLAYAPPPPPIDPVAARMYGEVEDGGWVIPGADATKMEARNVRQVVDYATAEPAGTIVVDPHARFLYLVMEDGKAMRYGVGVGKAGLEFTGEATSQPQGRMAALDADPAT